MRSTAAEHVRQASRSRKASRSGVTAKACCLGELPNLGPKSEQMLRACGITTLAQLRKLGSVAAYARVKATHKDATLNLLWALEGALTGLRWQEVAREHRTSLLLSLEQLQNGG